MPEPLEVQQNTQFQLDLKTLIGLLAGFISIAGVYFTLTSEIAQLQIDNIRVQASVLLNEEFRIKWPRGELGALPDDARQDLRIEYLQRDLEAVEALIQKHFNEHDAE
jgi:hypothetical protein|tara:strand:- start:1496 stop:1819 length:324 start_codon:yes stop_codon:yes gene_type:complete